ncbi:MAG: hypothetical protein EOM30_06860 [Clostridia bacterium]|nr:hypothetical protein [Clostridia bacterium]NLS84098.1 hypothetical protein [Oscillospiraceae bacterium]
MDFFIGTTPQDEPLQPVDALFEANKKRTQRLRKKRRTRRITMISVLAVICVAVIVYITGLYGASLALLGDLFDSASIALSPGNGYPVDLSLTGYVTSEPLVGGFVAVGDRDAVIYSATGKLLRTIGHTYARPCVTTGSTRVCIYNRGSVDLTVESRTRTLYTLKADDKILLAEMSNNGTLAVATKSRLTVYDPLLTEIWYWKTSEVVMSMAFATDNKRLAAACLYTENGALGTKLHLFDTSSTEPAATVTTIDGIPVAMKYITRNQLLVVYDNFASIYDASTGAPLYTYSYGGKTLQSVSTESGKNTVLLFSDDTHTSLTSLVVLDNQLAEIGKANVGKRTVSVSSDSLHAYVMTSDSVLTYALDGTLSGSVKYDEKPRTVLNAQQPLLILQSSVQTIG